jgi:hypothetical protein
VRQLEEVRQTSELDPAYPREVGLQLHGALPGQSSSV